MGLVEESRALIEESRALVEAPNRNARPKTAVMVNGKWVLVSFLCIAALVLGMIYVGWPQTLVEQLVFLALPSLAWFCVVLGILTGKVYLV